MSETTLVTLAERWRLLWNGDLALGREIIADDFVAHAAPMTGSGDDLIRGRTALEAWISGIHELLDELAFTYELGPITQGNLMAVRWRARGCYRGGFPGSPPEAIGRAVTFTGTDSLRTEDGCIVEYWGNADSLLFVQQLGVQTMPGY
ncbi:MULTISPECIES: ester cyclase [Alphaproteobacteria]|nr:MULTISPECIES: ester cyclase [Alphaproteobacteria]MBX3478202.1 ester cyclase [Brevundimonas sp.]NGM32815.1 ester cyclase [Methylobacterium sp. DB0501]